jgi:alpha-aminoadipic semialdehyde synthase
MIVGKPQDIIVENLKDALLDRLGGKMENLQVVVDLGLLDDEPIDKQGSPLDSLSTYLSRRLVYEQGERDIIVMRHDVHVEWPDKKEEIRHLDFVCYGDGTDEGYSAMAKTVGYACAIAAKMVLTGEIQDKGMVVPMAQHIYRPILNRLKEEGFTHRQSISNL